jgi:hypothetical protein
MMKKLTLSLCLAAGLVLPALAQDRQVDLKISLWVPPAHPLVPATKEWAADIEKASGGTIKSVVFPSEQLGKAFRLSARPLPDHRDRSDAVHLHRRPYRHAGARRFLS